MELPVYLTGSIKAGRGSVFLGVGPHIGYGFSADKATESIEKGEPGHNRIELNHGYLGGGAIAGYEFPSGISLSAGYKLSGDFSSSRKTGSVTTQTVHIGISYRF